MKILVGVFFAQFLLLPAFSQDASECTDAGLEGNEFGLCTAYCEALECVNEDVISTQCASVKSQYLEATGEVPPCELSSCDLIDPGVLFERISFIENPDYICYSDSDTPPYTYVEYIVESDGTPQIGLGMEDQFDGTWYGYYFEYQPGSPGELPEFFRYDLTAEEVAACREAFEPPFACP